MSRVARLLFVPAVLLAPHVVFAQTATPGEPNTSTNIPPPGNTEPTTSNALRSAPPPAESSTAATVGNPTQSASVPPRSFFDGFSFGSYGRVVIGTDLRGRVARPANLIAHGTRIDEQTYAELELHRDDTFGEVRTRVVATLAIEGPLFHETGTFDIHLAVRNLYVEERGAFARNLAIWMGSRMYRGDDIYLLNWWPLDNLNTVGGGARYDVGEYVTVAAHGGMNRLDSNYQVQSITLAPREGFLPTTFNILDRPRFIGSLKATWWLMGRNAPAGIKISLYGEGHGLPDGVRQNTQSGRYELMPADSGYVVGAQIGGYTGHRNTFFNVFFRYGQGLGAYGDLAVPYTLTARQTSQRAQDVVLAVSGNWEREWFGIIAAGYVRYFRDADAALYGRSDVLEATVSVRPTVWIGHHLGIALEANWQAQQYNQVDPVTGVGPRQGSIWRFAVMPFVSPAGRGNFVRPHIRLLYAITVRDDGARRFYAPDDPFARNSIDHFLGLSSEWWFNSSYM